MDLIITHHWEIFISLEVLSLVLLLAFLIIRYAFSQQKISRLFLVAFIVCLLLEISLALFMYQKTGEIETFQIVLTLFVIYSLTFGISDFKKLDRYVKQKIGKWRGVNLLTEKDIKEIERSKDPKVIARKNRLWWYTHVALFIVFHYIFWVNVGNTHNNLVDYLVDRSWWSDPGFQSGPFRNEMVSSISKVWTMIFAIDTIVSLSYTFFPSYRK